MNIEYSNLNMVLILEYKLLSRHDWEPCGQNIKIGHNHYNTEYS